MTIISVKIQSIKDMLFTPQFTCSAAYASRGIIYLVIPMDRLILHSDLNNFYASVECLYNPSLRNKPVAVVGDIEKRHGIVLTKNYLAKKYHVKTGDALWEAQLKCPDIVFVPPDYERYLYFSQLAQDIYGEYTNQVEPFGLDECWLDVTGLVEDGKAFADKIRERITDELGITASIGVSYNKIFAKLGSDYKKPNATTVISRDNFKDVVWSLPVNDLLYVGRATHNKLRRYGIKTIGDLAASDEKLLKYMLGKNGLMLWRFANGYDTSPVANIGAKSLIKSVGNSTTAPRDLITDDDVKITMYVLAESVAARLREHSFVCSTVQISIRDKDLYSYDVQGPLPVPSSAAKAIFDKAFELYKSRHTGKPIRSIAVRACKLSINDNMQTSFLPEIVKLQKYDAVERAMDDIRRRFGHFSIQRGIMLQDKDLSSLDPKSDHIIHPTSYLHTL